MELNIKKVRRSTAATAAARAVAMKNEKWYVIMIK